MLQYFKLQDSAVKAETFRAVRGFELFKFLTIRVFALLFMAYSTLFVAVATPFVPKHWLPIYIIGALICTGILIRTVYAVWSAITAGDAILDVLPGSVRLTMYGETQEFNASNVEYIEYTLLSDIVIHQKKEPAAVFPAILLPRPERIKLCSQFVDMAPGRTEFFRKTWEISDAVVMAMILAVHIMQYGIQNFYIPSGSMENTLMIDDRLFAEKITFGPRIPQMLGMSREIPFRIPLLSRDIQRDDIIIFPPPPPGDQDKEYIKRCIAVAGDEFHIKDNYVWINGKKMDKPYIKGVTNYRNFSSDKLIEGVVPKGTIIAMGDNRENSQDSRYFGYVPVERIKARAFVLYFNWPQMKTLDFSRFGLVR